MTKIFPVQTAQPDSRLARPGPAAALAPAPHLPAEPARPRRPLRPARPGCPGPAAAPSRRGSAGAAPTPVPWLPAVRGLRGAAGPRLMAVREGRACAATPIQRGSQRPAAKPQLILRGEPTPRAGRAGRRAGILPGPPTPSPLPQDGSRQERAERGVRGARRARSGRYRSGSRTKKTMCGGGGRGQRRHLRVRGGAGRCGRGASSLPPRLQRRRLRVPSFGRLFGCSSAVCRGVWGADWFCFG